MRSTALLTAILVLAGSMVTASLAQEKPVKTEKKEELNLKKIADDTKYQNAMLFMGLKNFDKARQEFYEYLEIYTNGSHRREAWSHIGTIYFDRFDYRNAIRMYRSLYEEYPGAEEGIEAYYKMGICYQKMGKDRQALQVFNAIINEHPDSDFALKAKNQLDVIEMIRKESDAPADTTAANPAP